MPAPKTAPDALELLTRSGLLVPSCLKQIQEQMPPEGSPGYDPKEFLAVLVKQRVITPFQAKRLLAGYPDGFFLGKYRVLEMIGEGGMGKVYLAEQTSLKRPVALKLLAMRKGAHASSLIRFSREARAAARLHHPNVAQAYDFDQDGNIYYIAMEYVEGLDVQQLVDQGGPVAWPQACHLICQAANGLEHARQAGLVHRDIKPGNLIVQPSSLLKILDMGLVVFQTDADPLTLADQDTILGTADYIAPEQALNSHDVDTRADIYSLGATLYFMLTGKPPFPEKTVAQKLLLHQTKDPVSVRERAPDVPEGVEAVLRKMMAKDRDARYATPREVRDALLPFAKPGKLFDPSRVRFPRSLIEQYMRFGADSPNGSGRVSQPPSGGPPTTAPETDRPAASSVVTEVLKPGSSPAEPAGGGSATRVMKPPSGAGKSKRRKRRKKASNQHLWIGVAALCLLCVGMTVLLVFGLGGSSEPTGPSYPEEQAPAVAKQSGSRQLGQKAVLGPGALGVAPHQAAQRAPAGGTITLLDKPGGWRGPTIEVNGASAPSRGRLTITGDDLKEGQVVLHRQGNNPALRLVNAEGLTLKNLTLDGGNREGPLVEIRGRAAGVTLENLVVRNVTGEAVRLVGAQGAADRPLRVLGCRFQLARKADSVPLAFRSLARDDRSRHVEVEGCHFDYQQAGVVFAQPAESVTVRDCNFAGDNYGVKFSAEPTLGDDAGVKPVTNWRVAGWFVGEGPKFDPFAAPPAPRIGPHEWKTVDAPRGQVDLTKVLGQREGATAVAYASFHSDSLGKRRIYVGCDDEATVWVNGVKVFEHRGHQGVIPREFSGVADFYRGENHIWVQVVNGASGSGFSLHVAPGYVPLTAPDWKNVRLVKNTFVGCSKAVVFAEPPVPGAKVELTGNTFRRVRHHPVLVLKSPTDPLRPGTIATAGNVDAEVPRKDRKSFDDATAFELVPLGK